MDYILYGREPVKMDYSLISEASVRYHASEWEELKAYFEGHPGNMQLWLKYIRAKRDIKEAMEKIDCENLLGEEE